MYRMYIEDANSVTQQSQAEVDEGDDVSSTNLSGASRGPSHNGRRTAFLKVPSWDKRSSTQKQIRNAAENGAGTDFVDAPSLVLRSLHNAAIGITRSAKEMATENGDAFVACLQSNKQWADETAKKEQDFFANSAKGQAPPILWIGCSDSRVPETTVLGFKPGDVFTHRNIANIVNSTDLSLLSVVEFSVKHLQVKHVVLCGHTSCGGVNATLGNKKLDVLDLWLQPMRALREQHAQELDKLGDQGKATYLAKLNVKAGVERLRRMAPVLEATRDRGLQVHGVIYDLATGRLEDLQYGEDESAAKQKRAAFEME